MERVKALTYQKGYPHVSLREYHGVLFSLYFPFDVKNLHAGTDSDPVVCSATLFIMSLL